MEEETTMNFLQNFGIAVLLIAAIVAVAAFVEWSIKVIGGDQKPYRAWVQTTVLVFWLALIAAAIFTLVEWIIS